MSLGLLQGSRLKSRQRFRACRWCLRTGGISALQPPRGLSATLYQPLTPSRPDGVIRRHTTIRNARTPTAAAPQYHTSVLGEAPHPRIPLRPVPGTSPEGERVQGSSPPATRTLKEQTPGKPSWVPNQVHFSDHYGGRGCKDAGGAPTRCDAVPWVVLKMESDPCYPSRLCGDENGPIQPCGAPIGIPQVRFNQGI